jgi:hypothetical protein
MLALAFGLVVAVKLAVDINTIKVESANVDGDTVTVTGGSVEVKRGSPCPRGYA